MVCALSFLREHDGANDGNDGCEGRGAFSMRAVWLPVRVGCTSGRVFIRLSRMVRQDGDDDDGCEIQGRREQREGNKNQEEGHNVVYGLSFLRAQGDNGAHHGNNGVQGREALQMLYPSQQDNSADDDGRHIGWREEQLANEENHKEGKDLVSGLSRESDFMSSLLQEGKNDVGGRRRFGLREGENRREDQDVDCGLHCNHPPSLSTDGNCEWDVRRGGDTLPSQVTHLSPSPLIDARFLHLLCSPSSLASTLGQIPTPQREAYFSVLLGNVKCTETLNKVSEPVTRSLNFGQSMQKSNMILPSPRMPNPFNYH